MNGMVCSSRPMRISAATPKKTTGVQHQYAVSNATYAATTYIMPQMPFLPPENDPTNAYIFIGNLDHHITEEDLKQLCSQFGEIVYVNIPESKGAGVLQFITRASAEEAIQRLQGTKIGQQAICVSWGRNSTANQALAGTWGQQIDPSQWNTAYYSYGQGFDAYAYGAAQDPSLYAYGAYAGYTQYPQHADGVLDTGMEQNDGSFDPLATPDVDSLNGAYLAVHGSSILGQPIWLTTSSLASQASCAASSIA